MTWYAAKHAYLPGGVATDMRIQVADGRIAAITHEAVQPDDVRLPGLVMPGFANTHSHAFHRALRGRTHENPGGSPGSFWTWRGQMYDLSRRLNPDNYFAMARATYAEMALAGVTSVGEFHYLHHEPGGRSYADPNAMGAALAAAAADAGIRLTLLDTCYLAGGLSAAGPLPLEPLQLRFTDGTAAAWADRVSLLQDAEGFRIGAAIHSVRAVPREQLPAVVAAARDRPLHVHLSEQPSENEQSLVAYGRTPTQLLDECGALAPATTAIHATHLTREDIARLGETHTAVSMCPTTERDLADGIGPARALRDAGCPVALGTDQHVLIDMLEEARALEMDERLASQQRGRFSPAELVSALTVDGQRSIGWSDAGELTPGRRADLVALRLDSPRTAGADPAQAVLAASAADIDTVLVDGRIVVSGGHHRLGDVGQLLCASIGAVWSE
jgi:formiminoglutamate deiminase